MVEWSAAIASGAFVVLVAGALIAIRTMLVRMENVQRSAEAIRDDMHRLSAEVSAVLQPAEQTLRAVQEGVRSADGLFQAVKQVGGTIQHTTSAVEKAASILSDSAARHAQRIAQKRQVDEAVQWAELGLTAWQLWQSGRRSASSDKYATDSESTS